MVTASAGGRGVAYYGNSFRAIPGDVAFRPVPRAPEPRIKGLQPAIVTDNNDPEKLGRVKVLFPWLDSVGTDGASWWIRIATMGAGKDRGVFWLPEVGDEVLVSFINGDLSHPVIIGSVWNGKDRPTEEQTPKNDRRTFTSRSGHKLTFDDTDRSEAVTVSSKRDMTLSSIRQIALDTASTQVRGVLASDTNAAPGAEVRPGERYRDNAIVAWAKVSGNGVVVGTASFGVASVTRGRVGSYRIVLTGAATSAAELVPIAAADVPFQPQLPAEVRLVSVNQVNATTFEVYISSLATPAPVDNDFVFMATAR